MKHCDECGQRFKPIRDSNRFCTPRCKNAFHTRRHDRGIEIVPLLMDARRWPRPKGGMSAVSRIVDRWLREDRDRNAARAARIEQFTTHHQPKES